MICDRKIGPFDCCTVIQGDCRVLLGELPDKCVDLVFADPPYGIFKAAWDETYPAGFEQECIRVGKQVAITPGMWELPRCLEEVGSHYVGIIAARNLNGMTFSSVGFGNWIPTVLAGQVRRGTDAFEFSVDGDKPDHPSPKPIQYMDKIISRLTEPGDIVLDPFLGSGTTAVAAVKQGRHYLGFELSHEYAEQCRKRIALVEAQPNLFQPKAEQLSLTEEPHV